MHLDTNACAIFNIIKHSLVCRVYKFLAFDIEIIIALLEYERDRYRNIAEFPSRSGTHSHIEDVHSRSRLSESFTYLEKPTYSKRRSRGGSDDNRDFARGTDKQKSMQRTYEEASFIRRNQNSQKCICSDRTQETLVYCTDRSMQHVACYELSVTTDHQAIRADVPAGSRYNSLHHESQSTNVSSPEGNGRVKTPTTPEQTRSREKTETRESIEDATGVETERSFTLAFADATVSSTESNLTIHSSQNNPDDPTASTSKWESPASSGRNLEESRASRTPFCATAIKFWRRRLSVRNKTTAPVLKWSRKSIGRKELSSTAATTYDSGVKITQIEPSTVQTAQEGNKRRAYVNVQVQTPDAFVTRILSELLLSEKKRRVLMSIILQSESDHDSREAETQTSLNDVTSGRINMFSYPDKYPPGAITSKTVQCFVCDKPDCYEIKHSDNSISLEEAIIAEYPETSELNDHLAERKTDIKIPP